MLKSALLGILFACWSLGAAAEAVGRIDLLLGEVSILDSKAKSRAPRLGDAVQEGDTITTGKEGEIHLSFEDGSVLALRPDAQVQIVSFRAKGKANDGSVVALLRGTLRAITGLLGRRKAESVLVRTPTATIGIRGTDHEAAVIPPGSDLGEPGTYDKVNAGGTRITSRLGSVDVSPGQAGFAPHAAAPVVLPAIPAFFVPREADQRLEGVNDRLQRAPEARAGTGKPAGGKGGTQIQGNTRINATASNVNAVATGSDNKAANRIGTIGGD
ncbi:hypothetical protein RHDC4_01644 [Rhodocyclaceae bacterium]|nr:hypothetical protein RHDC4_01644 [Rhodocyclaceae bacterium]